MDEINVLEVGYIPTEVHEEKEYMDNDIVVLDNVQDWSSVCGSFQMDRFMSLTCYAGKLQLDINAKTHTIHAGEVLICHINNMLCNLMLSPDFEGVLLCLRRNIITELFTDNIIRRFYSHFDGTSLITISPKSLKMMQIYNEALCSKIKMEQTGFRKKIICSLIKVLFYEILENIGGYTHSGIKVIRQGEVLFKQFIELLSGCNPKPRDVSWYAKKLCITPKHLSSVCKHVSGKTAFKWISEYVLIDIHNLLGNTNKSIKEIVYLLNFPNISFFGTYCRKHFGMSPMEYRIYLKSSVNNDSYINEGSNHK